MTAEHNALKPLPPISVEKKEKDISKSKIIAIGVVCVVVVAIIIATAAGVPIALTSLSKVSNIFDSKLYQSSLYQPNFKYFNIYLNSGAQEVHDHCTPDIYVYRIKVSAE
jgi:hypothetical protein